MKIANRRNIRWQTHEVHKEVWEITHKDKVHWPRWTTNKKYDQRHQQITKEDTWNLANRLKCGRVKTKDMYHKHELGNRDNSYYGRISTYPMTKWETSSQTWPPSTISTAFHQKIGIQLSRNLQHSNRCAIRSFSGSALYNSGMVHEGSHNVSANCDLQKAREAYETQTTQK